MNSDEEWVYPEPNEEAMDAIDRTPVPPLTAPAVADAQVAAPAAASLPPLSEVLHDTEYLRVWHNASGTKRIQCLWCNRDFPGNATKILFHLCGIKGKGIAPCVGNVDPIHRQRYNNLLERKASTKGKKNGEVFFMYYCLFYYIIH